MSFVERLWQTKSYIYPRNSHIPDLEGSNIFLKPSTTMEKSALRRLASNKSDTSDVELVLRKYSLAAFNKDQSQSDLGSDPDDDPDDDVEIRVSSTSHVYSMCTDENDEHTPANLLTSNQTTANTTNTSNSTNNGDIITGNASECKLPKTSTVKVSFYNLSPSECDGKVVGSISKKRLAKNERINRKKSDCDYVEKREEDKAYPIPIKNEFHKIIFDLATSKTFNGFILFIILLNTLMLVVSTSVLVHARVGWYFTAIDYIFLAIYLMEIILKLYAFGLIFFKEGWNILDFSIVVFNMIDFLVPLIVQNMSGLTNGAAILRTLRVFRAVRAIRALRALRTIRFLANLQAIMATILKSVKSIGTIVLIISLFMYMFAVIGRSIYAKADPLHFANIFTTIFTLFQLLTLDDWFEIYQTVVANNPGQWHVILYLLLYIVVEYFVFLNLFVAVLVDNFQLTLAKQNNDKNEEDIESYEEDINGKQSIISSSQHQSSKTDEASDSEDEEECCRKDINGYGLSLKEPEKKEVTNYFSLLASLEYNLYSLQEHQRMLDMMINLCSDENET